MKYYIGTWMLLISSLCRPNIQPTPDSATLPDYMAIHINNHHKPENHNHVSNHNHIEIKNPPKDPDDCTALIEDELIKKMQWLSNPKWAANILAFSPHKRELYVQRLPIKQVKVDLMRLSSHETGDLIKVLGPDGQRFLGSLKKRLEEDKKNRKTGLTDVAITLCLFLVGIG